MCIVFVAGFFIFFWLEMTLAVHSLNCFPEYYDAFEKIF